MRTTGSFGRRREDDAASLTLSGLRCQAGKIHIQGVQRAGRGTTVVLIIGSGGHDRRGPEVRSSSSYM